MTARFLTFTIPIRVKNPGNMRPTNTRLGAVIQRRERTKQHQAACFWTRHAMCQALVGPPQLVPCRVTLTRVGAGRLDPHDGLPSACKYIVDGIAEALGVDDGGPAVSWSYEQRKAPPKTYAVDVRIERVQS